jgi:Uma2 family endonuclease
MNIRASLITSRLIVSLGLANRSMPSGHEVVQGTFRFPAPVNGDRQPTVAFVSYSRWAADRGLPEGIDSWEVVPDLAVEVVGPGDSAQAMMSKISEYFAVGVKLVWVVYPQEKMVHVYDSLKSIRSLTESDELSAGDILPSYRLPVGSLFPISAAPSKLTIAQEANLIEAPMLDETPAPLGEMGDVDVSRKPHDYVTSSTDPEEVEPAEKNEVESKALSILDDESTGINTEVDGSRRPYDYVMTGDAPVWPLSPSCFEPTEFKPGEGEFGGEQHNDTSEFFPELPANRFPNLYTPTPSSDDAESSG